MDPTTIMQQLEEGELDIDGALALLKQETPTTNRARPDSGGRPARRDRDGVVETLGFNCPLRELAGVKNIEGFVSLLHERLGG